MYTEEQVRGLDGDAMGAVIDALSRDELERVFCHMMGWAPAGIAAALNMVERNRAAVSAPEPPAVVAGEVEPAAAPAKRQTWGDHFRDNPAHPASDARLERDRGLSA